MRCASRDVCIFLRWTFGLSSSLEQVSVEGELFSVYSRIVCVWEGCKRLYHITFGSSSSLERIGNCGFAVSSLADFENESSVRMIGGGAFAECALSSGVVCGGDSFCFVVFDGSLHIMV